MHTSLWIDEFWRLLDDPYFESFVREKLKTIRKKDGIVITSTQSPADALNSGIAAALLEQTPTKIFLPNEYADEGEYRDGFKLSAMLPNPVASLHDFLPAAGLDPDALLAGPLAGVADTLREANELYSTAELFGDTHLSGAARQYQERSDFVYAYMALAQEAYEGIAARRATLEAFADAAGSASTQKAVLDLNTRIGAENALLLNDLAQLQALQLMAML
jgi:hypothetical protein